MSGCGVDMKPMQGGRRASRKVARKVKSVRKEKATRKKGSWAQKVKELYHKMKKTDKNISFRDVLIKASKMKKAGQL